MKQVEHEASTTKTNSGESTGNQNPVRKRTRRRRLAAW